MGARVVERLTVRTRDVDAARSRVADLFCPHRLEPRSAHGVDLSLDVRRMGSLAVVELDYGHTVEIDPVPLTSFYLVQIPLAGTARVAHAGREILSDPTCASVLSPHEPSSMTWHEGNRQLLVYLERTTLEAELGRLMGRSLDEPLTFELGLPMTTPAAQAWLRTIRFLADEAGRGSPLLDGAACVDALTRTVAAHLLETHPHSLWDALHGNRAAAPGTAHRAADFIDAHLAEPLTVSTVAAAMGIGTRGLQDAFRRELGTTPLAFIRDRRLDRARELLLRASPASSSVTDVAMAVGVAHLGRFAGDYQRRFGQTPSATLRQS